MAVYVITGGCGFIGSHIAEALVAEGGHEVRVLDNLSSGREENIAHLGGDVQFTQGDVRDVETVGQVVQGADYIFHEAALVSVFDSVEKPRENHEINLTGTLNMLQAGRDAGVKRVVLASSAAVYGNDPTLPKREDMRPQPESPYGLAKIGKEYYARVFSKLYGMPTISLRYFNVYGPRQDPHSPYSGVISVFVDRVLKGAPVTIFGDGQQSRDFVFVKDVVQANLKAMYSPRLDGGEVFNIATGSQTSLLDLLAAVNEITGSGAEPGFDDERAGDIRHSVADISKAESLLGYKLGYSLTAGLAKLIDACRSEM